jgi:hypothetical protein
MGLFDFFKTQGALSNQMGPPTQQQMVNQMASPTTMDTGMKLMLLGQAMRGNDVSGNINEYQQGIRDRFRQRQQDQQQRKIQNLNMQNTQQQMDQRAELHPGAVRAGELGNQRTDLGNVRSAQQINQANVGNAEWIGDNQTGAVMQRDPNTGQLVDVTSQYSPAQIAAFKAAKNPSTTGKNQINPGVNRTLTQAEVQRDKTFAKELETFRPEQASGNIGVLSMIADELSTEEAGDSTGLALSSPFKSAARIIDREGDMGLRAILDQEGIDKQQIVAGVIQQNLRQTLGAQFTQREGMLLIDRAYNPTLPPQMNAKRLKALAMLAEAALKARQRKVEYYNNNDGSLAGYDPQMDAGLEAMKAQVLQVYAANGGVESGSTANNGTTSTGTSWSVSPSN